ncbi:nucleolar transcription factor 1-A-like isoform X2 [Periplaneta americana]
MVSKKKRPPPLAVDATTESIAKKIRPSDGASTSHSFTSVASKGNGGSSRSKKSKEGKSVLVKTEDEEDIVPHHSTHPSNDDIPDWPEADLMELMRRMEKEIPQKDSLRFDSRADKLNWENISFSDYSAEQCREMWGKIQKRLRRFRLLREVLEDAKAWVSKPWTNFYRSQKQNRHPDLPRRPLSTYMLFYLEKKDRVARENPGLEMTGVSKCIAEMYKNLPAKKKQKYVDMAAAQRREYELKLEEFYREHPDLVPKPVPSKDHKAGTAVEMGPRKPTTPFKLFYADKENRHKNDPDFDRTELLERCREQWRSMSDKKKVVWINWALEEEAKYQEELKAYMSENPNFVPSNVKAILTKEEKNLKERVAGKPEKPPNSGYSLFSRIMLVSPQIKQVAPKERMSQISKLWKSMSENEKKKYQEQVNHMLDQYKLEYATYLESLPEDKRQEELQNNQPKRKATSSRVITSKPVTDTVKEPKKKNREITEEKTLYKGEPEPPPVNAYQLFLKTFMTDASHIDPKNREKEAPRYWQMLPDADKAKHRKRLNDIKQKYIRDYEKFLKSLSQEQLKDYSLQKASLKKEEEDSSDDSDSEDDNEEDDDDDDDEESSAESKEGNSDNQQESGSDDESSSDSGSDSNDSSDSSDSEADNNENNSGESSSSGSDSD